MYHGISITEGQLVILLVNQLGQFVFVSSYVKAVLKELTPEALHIYRMGSQATFI